MLVCVDVGNTNIVVGIFQNDHLLSTFRLETKIHRTEDEYGIRLVESVKYHNLSPLDTTGIIIASVVPEVDATLEKAFTKYFGKQPLFVGPGLKTGIPIKLDQPKQLGSDLLVGAVAATSKYGHPCIIIDMGTAITLSVVNDKKEFLGGIIYPGIFTAYNSLVKNTSLLEAVKIKVPTNIIGRDTISSIQSGMIYGTVGAIEGMVKRICDEVGSMKVILTGGMARYIAPFVPDYIYDEDLLMDGLKIIYEKNQPEKA
ncbi:MAG: type III pantothenate kinase [Bacilli bacterium]|nr:type III pantothenate kinase [Bacilli bacterium]